jgi:hypothetical protein
MLLIVFTFRTVRILSISTLYFYHWPECVKKHCLCLKNPTSGFVVFWMIRCGCVVIYLLVRFRKSLANVGDSKISLWNLILVDYICGSDQY